MDAVLGNKLWEMIYNRAKSSAIFYSDELDVSNLYAGARVRGI